MAIEPLSLEDYSNFIESHPVAVVHVWASWNHYDKEVSKVLEQIDSLYAGNVGFGSVDVDREEMREIYVNARILNVPVLIYYRNGEYVETKIGLEPKEKIEQRLKVLLSNRVEQNPSVQS